jgi:hypothetical protein
MVSRRVGVPNRDLLVAAGTPEAAGRSTSPSRRPSPCRSGVRSPRPLVGRAYHREDLVGPLAERPPCQRPSCFGRVSPAPCCRMQLPPHLQVLVTGRQRQEYRAADQAAVLLQLDGPAACGRNHSGVFSRPLLQDQRRMADSSDTRSIAGLSQRATSPSPNTPSAASASSTRQGRRSRRSVTSCSAIGSPPSRPRSTVGGRSIGGDHRSRRARRLLGAGDPHALIPRPNDALVISKRPIRLGYLVPHADLNVGRVAFGKGGQRRPASGSCTAGRS